MEYTILPIIRTKQLSSDYFEVILKRKREILYRPGDCVYIKKSPSDEFKPYFIASGIQEPWVRIIMRGLASDFTTVVMENGNKLRAKPELVNMFPELSPSKRPIFLCAGVGVGPFLSYISSYPGSGSTVYIIGEDVPNLEWLKNYKQAFILPSVEWLKDTFSPGKRANYYISADKDNAQAIKSFLASVKIKDNRINCIEFI